jgi:hypothetical protein
MVVCCTNIFLTDSIDAEIQLSAFPGPFPSWIPGRARFASLPGMTGRRSEIKFQKMAAGPACPSSVIPAKAALSGCPPTRAGRMALLF